MTDWFAVADTRRSSRAGLDLEMPGPGRAYGPALLAAVEAGEVEEGVVDAMVRRLLTTFARFDILDDRTLAPGPGPDRPEDRALVRRAAISATVLLHNDGILPLATDSLDRVAVLGPNAADPCIMGGGSAQVTPHPVETPFAAIRRALPGVEVRHERGCDISRSARPLGSPVLPSDTGFRVEVFAGTDLSGPVLEQLALPDLRFLHFGTPSTAVPAGPWSARVHGTVVPRESGRHQVTLAQCGRTRVYVDGALVLDGVSTPPPHGGAEFFGLASQELVAELDLTAGRAAEVVVEFATHPDELANAVKVGVRAPVPADLLERAVAAAAEVDVAVVVVGTTDEWESEGFDRETFALPGRQDELVRRVAAANPRTVVVVNAGAPVDLAWADEVAAVLQCWLGGQEMGGALADILTGVAEPGGRLPTSIPVRLEHNPSYDNFPGENGELRYGEGLFMGYRGHDHRAVPARFAFGHGLGYTSFELGAPEVAVSVFRPGDTLAVRVPVTNTGAARGSEVVQCYVAPDAPRLARPPKELKAFAKVTLDPGEHTVVSLSLDDRSFSYWDPGQADWEAVQSRRAGVVHKQPAERRPPGWQLDAGTYQVLVGRSSVDLAHAATIEVTREGAAGLAQDGDSAV
jgi:beta-glucosidase